MPHELHSDGHRVVVSPCCAGSPGAGPTRPTQQRARTEEAERAERAAAHAKAELDADQERFKKISTSLVDPNAQAAVEPPAVPAGDGRRCRGSPGARSRVRSPQNSPTPAAFEAAATDHRRPRAHRGRRHRVHHHAAHLRAAGQGATDRVRQIPGARSPNTSARSRPWSRSRRTSRSSAITRRFVKAKRLIESVAERPRIRGDAHAHDHGTNQP